MPCNWIYVERIGYTVCRNDFEMCVGIVYFHLYIQQNLRQIHGLWQNPYTV